MIHSNCGRRLPFLLRVLIGLSVAWTVGAAMPAFGQHKEGADAKNGPRTAVEAEPRYLLFWVAPERVADLAKTLGVQGDGRTRLLGFGVACSTFVQEKQVADSIHRAFTVARRDNLAVMLHFDFHVELSNRPDLWNWFDPKKPGYSPDNRRNVEWFGWDGPLRRAT